MQAAKNKQDIYPSKKKKKRQKENLILHKSTDIQLYSLKSRETRLVGRICVLTCASIFADTKKGNTRTKDAYKWTHTTHTQRTHTNIHISACALAQAEIKISPMAKRVTYS